MPAQLLSGLVAHASADLTPSTRCARWCSAALKIFLEQQVDVVVLEVGVGGRLDATNIVPEPVVCGITSLGFDHMDMLGDTLPVS